MFKPPKENGMSNRNETNHSHNQYVEVQDTYHFNFDASGTRVLGMTENDDGRVKSKSLRGWTFEVKADANGDALAVSRSQTQLVS